MNCQIGIFLRLHIEIDGVRTFLAGIRRYADSHRKTLAGGRGHFNFRFPLDFNAVEAGDGHDISMCLLRNVHYLKPINVFYQTALNLARQHSTITDYVNPEIGFMGDPPDQANTQADQDYGVDDDSGTNDVADDILPSPVLGQGILRRVTNQSFRIIIFAITSSQTSIQAAQPIHSY